jgi:hypothetical protein
MREIYLTILQNKHSSANPQRLVLFQLKVRELFLERPKTAKQSKKGDLAT